MSLVPVLTPLGTARTSWSKLSNFSVHPQHLTEQSLLCGYKFVYYYNSGPKRLVGARIIPALVAHGR